MLRLLGGEKNGGAYCVVTRTACSMFIASVTRLTLTTEAREIGFYSCWVVGIRNCMASR